MCLFCIACSIYTRISVSHESIGFARSYLSRLSNCLQWDTCSTSSVVGAKRCCRCHVCDANAWATVESSVFGCGTSTGSTAQCIDCHQNCVRTNRENVFGSRFAFVAIRNSNSHFSRAFHGNLKNVFLAHVIPFFVFIFSFVSLCSRVG